MGRKDAASSRVPVDQYRKQIGTQQATYLKNGRQDYKKTKPVLRATRLKAEAKKTGLGIKDAILVLIAVFLIVLSFYAFFYLKLSSSENSEEDSSD
uniref:Triple QxxK/R motif-containing protein n=1 Tax=Leptobrachium leishanense TaxID=445787 RepID=A0A8C5Q1Q4_9ANUR